MGIVIHSDKKSKVQRGVVVEQGYTLAKDGSKMYTLKWAMTCIPQAYSNIDYGLIALMLGFTNGMLSMSGNSP